MTKGELLTLKGQKVIFKVVDNFPDLKVQFVDHFGDLKVKISNSKSFTKKTIKIKVVTSFPDVKIEKVKNFGDIEAYIE
jgi:S-adenosylmethionine hydrolase